MSKMKYYNIILNYYIRLGILYLDYWICNTHLLDAITPLVLSKLFCKIIQCSVRRVCFFMFHIYTFQSVEKDNETLYVWRTFHIRHVAQLQTREPFASLTPVSPLCRTFFSLANINISKNIIILSYYSVNIIRKSHKLYFS